MNLIFLYVLNSSINIEDSHIFANILDIAPITIMHKYI